MIHSLRAPLSPAWVTPALVAAFLLLAAVMFFTVGVVTAALAHPWNRLGMGVAATGFALLITWAFTRRHELSPADAGVAWRRSSITRGLLGAAIGSLLFVIHLAVVATVGELRLERVPEVGLAAAVVLAVAYLALAAMEEIVFRGYPLRLLDRRYGLWVAQLVVAIAFIVYHLAAGYDLVSAIVGTGLGSLLFGMAALATRGLAVPIGLHAAWNYGSWLVGDKQDPGPWRAVVADAALQQVHTVGTISYVVTLSAATGGFWLWYRRRGLNRARD